MTVPARSRSGQVPVVKALLGLLLAVPLVLGACTTLRASLGPRDSVCFSSFPQARRAIGPGPQFAGVRLVPASTLVADVSHVRHHHIVPPDALADLGRAGACVFGYHGRPSAALLVRSWHPLPGPYTFAVVVVEQQTHRILAVVVLPREPLRFFHLI